jgi:hypothetical protein
MIRLEFPITVNVTELQASQDVLMPQMELLKGATGFKLVVHIGKRFIEINAEEFIKALAPKPEVSEVA